ncbi:MAG: hypothetical protein WKF84_27570 [Pyrinomonadaceae bacterium]
MTFKRIHVFESRDLTFIEDEVLQENIVFHATKLSNGANDKVIISSSKGPQDDLTFREVNKEQLVRHDDPDSFIHIVPDEKRI